MGLRERKRRETRRRIAEQALRLFLSEGYASTTLDAIAAASGISRRTFFSYFRSKDEIVVAWHEAAWDAILDDVGRAPPDRPPLLAVRDVLVRHAARYTSDDMLAIDRLTRSSDALRASKPATNARQEQSLFAALCTVWPEPERQDGLRVVAMLAIGTMRLAMDAWNRAGGDRPIADCLQDCFDRLTRETDPTITPQAMKHA